jgi:predicted ATPase
VILTPDQRLRVFVSSTLGELAQERVAVREAIEALRLAPVMFEMGARPHPPRALYRAYLEQSHVFLAIYAQRYGWVAPTMDISGLEDEYRLSGERPKLVYVLDPAPERDEQLTQMLADVADDPRVRLRLWSSTDELAALVSQDLAELLAEPFVHLPAQRVPESAPSRATQTPGDTGGALPLPVPATSIVGRDADIEATAALLRRRDVRLVTVTGMGGIGKSRLALEVAHRVQGDFPGGVVLVPLVEVPEPGLVITSIASRLGIRLDTTAPSVDVVSDALAERGEVLLLLDNAEHVRDAADDLAALIGTCPGLTLLVTSRSRLRLVAEHDYPLAPLDVGPAAPGEGFLVPDAELATEAASREAVECDAVRLFLDRARAARPGLDLAADPAQLAAVVELCRRLDGLPLAIELAAARVRLMPPVQLLERLEGSLDLPASRLADLPDRQRTLRSTLDWSHELLAPAERDLLAQLSTFVSGMSLNAVEQVARIDGDLLEALASLADHSLLDVDVSVVDAPRFTMLEVVREYARERLDESGRTDEVDRAHIAWAMDLSRRAHDALPGREHFDWLERLELEAGNIRAAGSRAYAEGDPVPLATIGFNVWLWLWARHHTGEARLWLARALDHAEKLDTLTRARVVWAIAGAAVEQGDNAEAVARVAEARALFTEVADAEGLALCGFLEASLAPLDGDLDRAVATFTSVEADLRAQGDVFIATVCASTAGMILAQQGKFEDAEAYLDRGLAGADSIESAMLRGASHVARGFARLGRGALDGSAHDFTEAARYAHECRNPESLSFACDGLAAVLLARGAAGGDETASVLVGAAQGLRERVGIVPWPGLRPVMTAIADGVRAAAGDERFETGRQRGRHLDIDAILELTASLVPASASA